VVRRGERQTARSGYLLATIGALADSAGWWLTSTIVGRGTCYQDPVNSDVSICGEAAWQSILALALIVAGGVLLLYIMWRLAVTLARAPTAANLVAFVVLWALSVGVVTIGTLFAVFHVTMLLREPWPLARIATLAVGLVFAWAWLVAALIALSRPPNRARVIGDRSTSL